MNATPTILEKRVSLSTFLSNFISIIFAVGLTFTFAYGFFYNSKTNDQQQGRKITEHDTEIKEIKQSVQKSAIFEAATGAELKSLQGTTTDIKEHLNRLEDKLDKIILQTKN